ncbi:MAG: hypothetical protein JW702_05470, partial [Clostridiales bacterium]|nr:hypothetical protein [Clostridiales bacterium]
QAQFWAWLDSFWHKDDDIPSAKIAGLQELLDTKVDKKDVIQQKGVFNPERPYVFDAELAEYVSYINEASSDEFYCVERWFRLLADTEIGESPESSTSKWRHIGTALGEIVIDDVMGLREELDKLDEEWSLIFVDNKATGANNGTSWVNAYTSLKTAINAARSYSIIMVAAREYVIDSQIIVANDYIRIVGAPGLSSDPVPILTGDINGDGNVLYTGRTIDVTGKHCHLENFVFEKFDTKTAGSGFTVNIDGYGCSLEGIVFRNIASYYGALRINNKDIQGKNISFKDCIGTNLAGIICASNSSGLFDTVRFDNLSSTTAISNAGTCLMLFSNNVRFKDVVIINISQLYTDHAAIYSVLSSGSRSDLFIENLTVENWSGLGMIIRCYTSNAVVINALIRNTVIHASTAAFVATHNSKITVLHATVFVTGAIFGNMGHVTSQIVNVNSILQSANNIHLLPAAGADQVVHFNSYLSSQQIISDVISYENCEFGKVPGTVSLDDLRLRASSININKASYAKLVESFTRGIPRDINGILVFSSYCHRGCFQQLIHDVHTEVVDVTTSLILNQYDNGKYYRYTGIEDISVGVSNTLAVDAIVTFRQVNKGVISLVPVDAEILNGEASTSGKNSTIKIIKVSDNLFDIIEITPSSASNVDDASKWGVDTSKAMEAVLV